jgi:RecG-like helicase
MSIFNNYFNHISIEHLKQLLKTSPRYLALLAQADITTVKDFLMNFPRTHEDRSNIKPIQRLDANGEIESVKACVIEKKLIPTKSPKKLYEIRIQDEE